MRRWSRWTDWVALVAGVYAFLAPIWTDTTTKASWTMVVLGVVTAGVALFSLAGPGTAVTESEVAVLGVLFFIAPWVMGFSSTTGIAWTAWIVGIVTFVVGLAGLPEGRRVGHSHHLVGQH
jgi:hypothetical protein